METLTKVLCCGDRNWTDYSKIFIRLSKLSKDTIIIQGEARGADLLSKRAAIKLGLKHLDFPANWAKYGKAAGPKRNKQMLEQLPDLVIAFHSNIESSKGTKNCIEQAKKRNIQVEIIK